jgi:hypothetical protein
MRMSSSSALIEDLALELAWSLWGELGVRGVVEGRHNEWAIDPEPLIVFTANLGNRDPRLRDESLDWCIRYERYLSRARLRGIARRAHPSAGIEFGAYAATLSEHTGRSWPGATQALRYRPSGRSSLTPLARPALIRIRLRALFGVGARAEILHAFVARPTAHLTAAELARVTGYTKRNVTDELERLELAGLLQVAAPSNQFLYRLHDRDALLAFVGARPQVFPNWEPLLRVVVGLLEAAGTVGTATPTVRAIELEKRIAELATDLREAGVPPPVERERGGAPEELENWILSFMRQLARGDESPDLSYK